MDEHTTSVVLCGVGGQGTILAAEILAGVALNSGLDVKQTAVHGMAQRGGAVLTNVRFGPKVSSMVIDEASADILLAFETTEAFRNLKYLKKDGVLFVNDESIEPLPVLIGNEEMPKKPRKQLKELGAKIIDASMLAQLAGNPKTCNVALIGAFSTAMDFDEQLWIEEIKRKVPEKSIEANLQAFALGKEAALR
ncbi:MAG: indolepyruvate oxidoreductase subunit beta [Coriobacteriia bacterium]|nr:indolepyruvate oxidoreductase subunit beta [Coriobacteriia bacterium]